MEGRCVSIWSNWANIRLSRRTVAAGFEAVHSSSNLTRVTPSAEVSASSVEVPAVEPLELRKQYAGVARRLAHNLLRLPTAALVEELRALV